MKLKKVVVIGGGTAGLAASAVLAAGGVDVTLLEKNETTGGRLRTFQSDGFLFDMGPSWYWMPEVFEQFFERFGKSTSDYYDLKRLDPSYRIWYGAKDSLDLPASQEGVVELFESIEPGSGKKLLSFLEEARKKYETGMGKFVWKPSLSVMEYVNLPLLLASFQLQLLSSMASHVRAYFRHPRLIQMMEFPTLFLGAKPSQTPALYSMMNYADISLGTWYPSGGMGKIADAMTQVATSLGVQIINGQEVTGMDIQHKRVQSVFTHSTEVRTDAVVAAADYHHVEHDLLEPQYRTYKEKFWNKQIMSPSCLLFYVGLNKKVNQLQHHNLFFDEPFEPHAEHIYNHPDWPERPQFYICCPSRTDSTVAPAGHENLFILIPVAPGLKSDETLRERYFEQIMQRLEICTGEQIRDAVVFKKSYAHEEFISDYHSFQGNAYGLANTLKQTAFMKPRMRSHKLENLFFAGQLTVPGPGLPPALISGQVAAGEVLRFLQGQNNRKTAIE